MITAFLIVTLILFAFSIFMSMIIIAAQVANNEKANIASIINIFIMTIMLSWNIFVLINL